MMDNPVYNDDYVKGSDLQQVIDQVNANEVFTDNMTITGNKSEAGMSLSVVDQYGGGGGGGGGDTIEASPFKISASGESISILGGVLNTLGNGESYPISGSTIDISDVEETKTVYIYAKVATTWFTGNTVNSSPVITIAGDEITSNDVRFPLSDLGHIYQAIGSVDITWDAVEEIRTVEVSQNLYTNIDVIDLDLHPFKIVTFFDPKATDIEDDLGVSWFSIGGNVTQPEGMNVLVDQKGNTALTQVFYYIKLSYTKNSDLYLEGYVSELKCSQASLEVDSATQTIIQTGKTTSIYATIQSISDDWRTDGKVW